MGRFFAILVALLCFAMPAIAEERLTLGFGRLFTNDRIGDGHDRWRTGSYSLSAIAGYGWDGTRPARFGDLIELRFRSEIIAPTRLYGPGSDDRPYVGALTYGLHSHSTLWRGELSAGIDVTATGPQTGVASFQQWYHETFSAPNLSDAVIAGQVPDGYHASFTVEYGIPLRLNDRVLLRPFMEVQSGIEEIARVGADVIWGHVGRNDLLIRDNPTGQLYRAVRSSQTGMSLVVGADWAAVGDSVFLPQSRGFTPEDRRLRARAGLYAQFTERADFFFGLTWMSEEFVGQPEGQLLGSLSVSLRF